MTEPTDEGAKSDKRPEGDAERTAADDVRRAFAGLPLDQKISTLIQVELDMLGDAFGSVFSAVSKAMDEAARTFESADQSGSATSGAGGQSSAS